MDLNGKSPVPLWVVSTAVIIIIGAALYSAAQMAPQNGPNVQTMSSVALRRSSVVSTTPTASLMSSIDASGWKTYQDTTYGFRFQFPREWGQPFAKSGNREKEGKVSCSDTPDH